MSEFDPTNMSSPEVQRLVQELKIENEALRKAAAESAEARDRYFDLYEFAPMGYVTVGKDGVIFESNRTAAEMLHIDRPSLLHRNLSNFISRESQAKWYAYRQAMFSTGTQQVCELAMERADGGHLAVRVAGIAMGRAENRRCRTALVDITGQPRVEEEISFSETKSSGILSISTDAIVSIDEDQRITLFNEGAEKIFGYSQTEVIGSPLDILVPERLRAIHRQHVNGFMTGLEYARRMGSRSRSITGLRKSGEEFPMDASISKLEVEGKQVMTATVRDVTEERRIESEQRFLAEVGSVLASTLDYGETLTNIAKLAVRELGDFCTVDAVEPEARIRRLKVVSRDESRTSVCEWLMHLPLRQGYRIIRPVIQNKRPLLIEHLSPERVLPFTYQASAVRRLHEAGFHSLLAVPLLSRGNLFGVITVISASASRTYGPADVRLAEELASRAAFSLENARLFGEARSAVKTRENVLAIVSHDLMGPVTTIGLAAHMLSKFDCIDGGKIRSLASTIQRGADRMQLLISDLLDVARLQSGTFSIRRSAGTVNQAAGSVIDGLKLMAEAKHQTLELHLRDDLPKVAVDVQRIGQVLANLVGNAIKFTPEGGTVRVSAQQRGNELVVTVADTGPGIPSEHLSKVFDWFWQVQGTKQIGSGLGLSIAKGIVEAHGGKIWAESQPGKGTAVSFTLSVASDDIRGLAA